MPGACKGLSSSRGFGCISNGVHAVRAELDTRPVYTLGISKAYAGVHACQNRSQEEARAEAGACATYSLLPSHQECHWDRRRLPFIFGDNLLAISYNNAGCEGFSKVGPGHNLCEPAEGLDGHEGSAFVNITVFLPASKGGQEEVSHKGHVQHQTGGFMQGPEVREVQACVEVLLARAHAKGSEQAR